MPEKKNFDVIVVGAGTVGCSIAYHLTRAGLKVALLDQEQVGAGASGANFGQVQTDDVELIHSIPMVTTSYSRFDHLEEELGKPFGFRRLGDISLISTESQWKTHEERAMLMDRAGIPTEMVPANRLQEIEPMIDPRNFLGAMYASYQGQVNPFRMMWAYIHNALLHGLSLNTYTKVTGFIVKGGRVCGVKTNQGEFSAGVTILATAAWSRSLGEILGCDWGIYTFRASAMVSEQVYDLHLRNIVHTVDHIELEITGKDDAELTVLALSQTTDGTFLIAQANRPGDDLAPVISHVAPKAIATIAGRTFPVLRRARILRSWVAPTTYTEDGCPFIGPVPGLQGLMLATAFRSAVSNSPIAGEIITQLVTLGRCEVVDIRPFAPGRQMNEADTFYKVKREQ